MGQCGGPGCERELFRGDIFFTPLNGKLYCVDCWEKVPGIDAEMHRVISRAVADMQQHVPTSAPVQPEKREQVWDGEFPS